MPHSNTSTGYLSSPFSILAYKGPGYDSSTYRVQRLEHLRKVVQAHTRAGINNQPQKTKIFQSEVDYLGHKVINPIPAGGGRGQIEPPCSFFYITQKGLV